MFVLSDVTELHVTTNAFFLLHSFAFRLYTDGGNSEASVSVEFSALNGRFPYFWTRAKWGESKNREGRAEGSVFFAAVPVPARSNSEKRTNGNAFRAGLRKADCSEWELCIGFIKQKIVQ